METKIHIKTNQASKMKAIVLPTKQTSNHQSFTVVTNAAEAETLKTVVASLAATDPSTILITIKVRRPDTKENRGKIDQLTTTTTEIAISEVEDTTTTLREAMETATTRTPTNATILTTSAIAGHSEKKSPKDSKAKILETVNPTALPSEAETAVQNAAV